MRYLTRFMVCIATALTSGANASAAAFDISIEGDAVPYTTLAPGQDAGDFTFAIIPDRTGGNRPGPFREAVKRVNALGPDFVMSIGDLIEGYSVDPAVVQNMWEELDGIVGQLRMPFFYVPGNHDISDDYMEGVWEQRYGPSYYHFLHKDVLFLVMNTEDPPSGRPSFSEEQIAYFQKVLSENTNVRWTFVFLHQPTWLQEPNPLAAIEEALDGRPYTVFAGHYHTYSYTERNGRKYIVCATAGGASALAGPLYGSFDHVVWVRMDKNGPDITNVLLNGLYGADVVSEETERVRLALKNAGALLSLPPVIVPSDGMKTMTVALEAENASPVPVVLTGSFSQNAEVIVSPQDIKIALAVKGRGRLDVSIEPQSSLGSQVPAPLAFEGTATYRLPDGAEVLTPIDEELAFFPAYAGRRWDFDDGLEGWGDANEASLSVSEGVLQVHATGADPYMIVDLGKEGPAGPLALRFRQRGSTNDSVQVLWTTEAEPAAAEHRSRGVLVQHDGAWHDYVVEFDTGAPLTTLRVDSGNAPGLIEYDYLELVQR